MSLQHRETPVMSGNEVDRLTQLILEAFPTLEPDSRRVAVQLYRLLARGQSVARQTLADAASISLERVNGILQGWSGVYYDGDDIQGFWGITPREFSKHLYTSKGQTSYAWCAWDTLFLPEILGDRAQIQSTCPESGEIVQLEVSPDGVLQVEPPSAVMSILEPADDVTEDIVARFCHFVFFFPSMEVGANWIAKNPGTRLISIEDAFELGKRRNRGQFKEALDIAAP
ncbi:MAG: organomercurial lyase [bacterium]